MIFIFDLDDTLYDERQYVESGFQAVADMAQQRWGLDKTQSFARLINLLDSQGRGRIFDDWLAAHSLANKGNIQACVRSYRRHKPSLKMPEAHLALLNELPKPLYLVTDGHKIVQQNKVDALGIGPLFKRVFITHRFGIQHAKPSTHCFELIKKAEGCDWQDMLYIGDNPAKDFVNLNKLGMQTVRVLTGVHRDVQVPPAVDATNTIQTLVGLSPTLEESASRLSPNS
ncbi:HAD family hydrolase [Bowmanella pacifica]|uniref:HAD superfamily hydrolase n=1 Tax=Bowmanella pacifica TaxID=502051 RepID=A0A917Z628_9ALTE|nr:HAD family hydrolase [Bowmanella pacifica]GGO73848.1 HAD superfamily hydrolase [Bowmanella pacifica]